MVILYKELTFTKVFSAGLTFGELNRNGNSEMLTLNILKMPEKKCTEAGQKKSTKIKGQKISRQNPPRLLVLAKPLLSPWAKQAHGAPSNHRNVIYKDCGNFVMM